MPNLPRGAMPSPRSALAAAAAHQIVGATPPQFIHIPPELSFWDNSQYGDCVTAEEAFAKACHQPEIFIPQNAVVAWAEAHGVLNGAYLNAVLHMMVNDGFKQSGHTYDDGSAHSVDWTNAAVLNNAIFSNCPVKIGVAANQLDSVVTPGRNGWIATGFHRDTAEDHCVSLCGFGPMGWLAEQLRSPHRPPNPAAPGYAMFTWNSIGAIDGQSMVNITEEAWVRVPTTVIR